MARLPQPGGDAGNWGSILNDYLSASHKADGTIKDSIITDTSIADSSISSAKLNTSIQASLTKADNALAAADAPLYPVGTVNATRVNRPSLVDLRDYIVSQTARTNRDPVYTFNVLAVVAAMEASNGSCYIPPGDWRPNTVNTPLDSNTGDPYNSPKHRFTYLFFGAGKTSRILFPSSIGSGDCIFIANSTNANDFHTHPKVIIRDIAIAGCDLPTVDTPTNGGFLLSHQRSFIVERVETTGCRNPFRVDGYTDLLKLSHVYAHDMASGSFILDAENSTGGDGWEFDHLIAYGTGGVKVRLMRGGTLSRSLSGWWEFIDSDVSLIDNHMEGDGAVNAIPTINIKGSRVHVRSGYYQARPNKPAFSIDDSTALYGSVLTVDSQVHSAARMDSPGSAEGAQADPFINIAAAGIQTTIHLHNVRTALFAQRGDTGASDAVRALVAPLVTATGSAAITTALSSTAARILLGMDCTIRWTNNQWEVQPYEQRQAIIGVPAIVASSSVLATVSTVTHSAYNASTGLAPGTYYYRLEAINLAGFSSQKSPERTLILGVGEVPQITIDTYTAPVAVTVWRGTSPDTYSHWARVWVTRESLTLMDQGTYIGGSAWSAVSVPAVHNNNETVECELLRRPFGGFRRRVYATAPPTVGTYGVGDQCLNTAPTAAGAPGWVCITAGYPGTWKAMANIAA